MVRTAPPVSVRVRTRVSVSFSFTVLHCVSRTFAIADLCDSSPKSGAVRRNISVFLGRYEISCLVLFHRFRIDQVRPSDSG